MMTFDRYHVLPCGESISDLFFAYSLEIKMSGENGIQTPDSIDEALSRASHVRCHPSLEEVEGEADVLLGENLNVSAFFVIIFKNGKLFGVKTHQGLKTFEVIEDEGVI